MVAALVAAAAPAFAQAFAADSAVASASRPPLTLTGTRSFSGPENTRIVFEFSRATTYVAPDAGEARDLTVTIPGEPVARAAGVGTVLRVRDGVVDSTVTETRVDGATFHLWLRDVTRFRVLALAAQEGQPYRLVVDVERRGAAQAVASRLEDIATGKKRDRVRVVAVDAGHGGKTRAPKGHAARAFWRRT